MLPNASGKFLRAINFNDNKDDVNKRNFEDRKLGSFQVDDFKSHDHEIYKFSNKYNSISTKIDASVGPSNLAGSKLFAITAKKGGNETRPKNIAVNVFVKVKRKCVVVDKNIKDLQREVAILSRLLKARN